MKLIYKAAVVCVALASTFSSCNSFLDVVPDERTKYEDTYADENKGRDFLYSCFGYLPNPARTPSGLDALTGDEVVTAFEHETFARFPKGTFTPSDPVISYWNSLYRGIAQCYRFLEVVDKIPDLTNEDRVEFKAQAKFAIALYHFYLFRCYGSIIVVKELQSPTLKASEFPKRSSIDETVEFITKLFDEAANALPKKQQQSRFGLGTSIAAKAFKAKTLIYAASPLYNGGSSLYAGFQDKDGDVLMPSSYDPQKWVKAKQAVKEAIDIAEGAGFSLYMRNDYKIDQNKFPEAGVERRMRSIMHDYDRENPEVIFADARGPGTYDFQLKSAPRTLDKHNQGCTGISPTWSMLNRFYTKNGLPWDEDPEFANYRTDEKKLELLTVDEDHKKYAKPGVMTMRFNLEREPRFYSWVTFQGGYFEIREEQSDTYSSDANKFQRDGQSGRVICDFLKNGEQGRRNRTNNYTPGGYLNKKACPPDLGMKRSGPQVRNHPWPIIRLADLYLLYAEALVENNDLAEAKTYLNKVRVRAGIPDVDASWAPTGVTLDQAKLRQIVRQERQIEFYLENQNFWDMRRWLLAEEAFGHKVKGMNIEATTIEEFAKLTEIPFERKFEKYHYFLPVPLGEIQKASNLVQNPGY